MKKFFFCLLFALGYEYLLPPVAAQQTIIDVRRYGAKCDGSTNDTTAFNAAIAAVTASGATVREIYVPAGTCRANIVITEGKGIKIRGAGRYYTTIKGIGSSPALAANGLWYSQFEGITFGTENGQSGKGVVEIDGNYDGTHTQGVQGNTFKDCSFEGNGTSDGLLSTYTFTMTRQGGSDGQGSECLFLNCHFAGATFAVYYQNGYNALNNTFIGGNFQNYSANGIYLVAGSVQLFSIGFQSVSGYTQIANSGYDINASSGGVNEGILAYGCRTESLRFYYGGSAQLADIRGLTYNPVFNVWSSSTAYTLNQIVSKSTSAGTRIFRVTTAGTSGSSEPTWPASGTVSDGSVVWTQTSVAAIDIFKGTVDFDSSAVGNGAYTLASGSKFWKSAEVTANYTTGPTEEHLLVDTLSGAYTITLSSDVTRPANGGQVILVQRQSNAANDVTITGAASGTVTLPGGTLDTAMFVRAGGSFAGAQWYLIGYYQDLTATITAGGTTGAQTINRYAGTVNVAADGASVTVTNSLVTANSLIQVQARTNDSTCAVKNYVPTSGAFTINMTAACAAETSVGFVILRR